MTAPFTSYTLPATEVRWVLSGPAGLHLDSLVAGLIGSGVRIEPIKAGEQYRLDDTTGVLDSLAISLDPIEGFDLAHEAAPTDKIVTSTALTARAYQRSFTVHGVGPAFSLIARAVDRWLTVTSVGLNRWMVRGPTSVLVHWIAEFQRMTPAEVLALYRISPESVEAEDAHAPLAVNVVSLPDRKTTSEIQRAADGSIKTFIQVETTP